jgi:IclR family acetate operon transcriptional repressor
MQVVERSLALLRELSRRTKGASLQELHETLGIPVGSTHRILAVLVQQDFVTRSPLNKRYFLGPAARELRLLLPHDEALLASPRPAPIEAAEATSETIFQRK